LEISPGKTVVELSAANSIIILRPYKDVKANMTSVKKLLMRFYCLCADMDDTDSQKYLAKTA